MSDRKFVLIVKINFRIAALIKSDDKYFCGGTVISNRKVVTGEILKDIYHFKIFLILSF